MTLSHPHVTTVDASMGCHLTPMQGPRLCALRRRYTFVVLQSQNHSVPSPSPEQRNLPFGEKAIWHAKPAVIWPLKFFFFSCLNFVFDAARRREREREGESEKRERGGGGGGGSERTKEDRAAVQHTTQYIITTYRKCKFDCRATGRPCTRPRGAT